MSEGELEYLPEQYRDSARRNHDSAEVADGLARRLGNATATSAQFGGSRAAGYTGGLNEDTAERSRRARRAQEDRDDLGDGGTATAGLGEDTDLQAQQALRAPGNQISRAVEDGM